MTLDAARAVADAVLYEGYLLYPYRASAAKNRSRWQFGVLGPPAAAPQAFAEAPDMAMQCLLTPIPRDLGVVVAPSRPSPISVPTTTPRSREQAAVTIHLRFLQLQAREVQRLEPDGSYTPVDALDIDGSPVLTWDEAVEREITLPRRPLPGTAEFPIDVPGGEDAEDAAGGRVVRRRWPLQARVHIRAEADGDLVRLAVTVTNEHPYMAADKDEAVRRSLLGAHLLIEAHEAAFVSLLDPPPEAAPAAARCRQHRCWPVLAGPQGTADILLGAPIILYDHPQVAGESPGALFDSTEIDEILTLRVMTMTDDEKAEARATDPRAGAIVDRCDAMTAADMQHLHGARRDTPDVPWWDPEADSSVDPGADVVVIDGVPVSQGSLVRVHPSRRADAQDLFFADRIARVTAVVHDVDGGVHVALVLVDDPAADLHDWYGRYFYFAPEELEPLTREENRS
jgi:hypothetical protein